jgi:hypothetical protein
MAPIVINPNEVKTLGINDLLAKLSAGAAGLSEAEAKNRLAVQLYNLLDHTGIIFRR